MTNEEYYDFKCRGCGEKFTDEFASANDVAFCKWCSGEMDIPVVDEEKERRAGFFVPNHLEQQLKDDGLEILLSLNKGDTNG